MDLELKLIRTDGGTQPREQLVLDVVGDYAEAMQDGAQFPPVIVFHDGESYWLADGFHRVRAADQVGFFQIAADVREGSKRDAVLYSAGANTDHGLRRTNADKRGAVEKLLHDEEWAGWSDREIARRCKVTDPFVGKVRVELTANGLQSPEVRRGADGRQIDTSNIGRGSPSAKPLVSCFIPETDPDPEELGRLTLSTAQDEWQKAPVAAREAMPEMQEALDREDVPGVLRIMSGGNRGATLPALRPSLVVVSEDADHRRKALRIAEGLGELARAELSGRDFHRWAVGDMASTTLASIPAVRRLMDEIEEGSHDTL